MSFVQEVKLARDFVGKTLADVPAPSFVIDQAKIKRNSEKTLDKVRELGDSVTFRAHVETLKSKEIVRSQLNNGEYTRAVVSTLEEIRQLVPLVEEGVLKDVLYSTPIGKSQVKELAYLKNFYNNLGASLRLVVDNIAQLEFLLGSSSNWSVMIKIDIEQDVTSNGFGKDFDTLLTTVTSDSRFNSKVMLFGFYCHAGASCGTNDLSISQGVVDSQLSAVSKAAEVTRDKLMRRKKHLQTIKSTNNNIPDPYSIPFSLSIGATPTVHNLHIEQQQKNENEKNNSNTIINHVTIHEIDTLEMHAGSFVALDLRQTNVNKEDIAGVVISEICSYRPSSHEYVINAGVLALSREQGSLPGFAHIKGAPDWAVTKVYQEHGIVSYIGDEAVEDQKLPFEIGDRVVLYPQNTCITSSCHRLYFVTNGGNEIVEIWCPWRYW